MCWSYVNLANYAAPRYRLGSCAATNTAPWLGGRAPTLPSSKGSPLLNRPDMVKQGPTTWGQVVISLAKRVVGTNRKYGFQMIEATKGRIFRQTVLVLADFTFTVLLDMGITP